MKKPHSISQWMAISGGCYAFAFVLFILLTKLTGLNSDVIEIIYAVFVLASLWPFYNALKLFSKKREKELKEGGGNSYGGF